MKITHPATRVGIELFPNDKFEGVSITKGAYNGYIIVSDEHPWYGKGYHELENIEVHGGLTFAQEHARVKGFWVFGFDTAHWDDDDTKWTFETVMAELLNLRDQAVAVANLTS